MPLPAMWVDQNELELEDVVAPCPRCGPQALREATLDYVLFAVVMAVVNN